MYKIFILFYKKQLQFFSYGANIQTSNQGTQVRRS
nr:MAG TPA: hypothetical protein [Caudoviricetes sp.]